MRAVRNMGGFQIVHGRITTFGDSNHDSPPESDDWCDDSFFSKVIQMFLSLSKRLKSDS